ncbi:MAG TPA: prepilin-type N-terminal cleavage/methylation domain-containing protein [Pyrinomonadaceae bacterium]|nr:prepilin-type N-terminal cleavage/methylation domain-containing protein [Pyrinomonadaceae bacterium]HNU06513.1 prepilin-type N-terminal cleavage/methylation domain-containing protein [Pyrinomonadaceae bacterium]
MKINESEQGFSLIETIIALVILLIGIMATLSAMTYAVFSVQESEKRTVSKEVVRSTMETVFSVRDLLAFDAGDSGGTYNWNALQNSIGNNGGVFMTEWRPVRQSPGDDGIFGTADDACDAIASCVVNGTTNSSPVVPGIERKILVTDIVENGAVRKRHIEVKVRYFVGRIAREETQSTIIAKLPVS